MVIVDKMARFTNFVSVIILLLLIINLIMKKKTIYEYILLILALLSFAIIFYATCSDVNKILLG